LGLLFVPVKKSRRILKTCGGLSHGGESRKEKKETNFNGRGFQ